ncbi:MAG: DUF4012 domain-containing protein [Patescibacteria group bacterium]
MRYIFAILIVLVLIGGVFAVGLYEFKNQAFYSVDRIVENLRNAKNSLFSFQPGEAGFYFSQIRKEVDLLASQLPVLSKFIPLLKNLPPIFGDLNQLTATAENLSERLDLLKREGVQWVINQKGGELVTLLEAIKKDVDLINKLTGQLKAQADELKFDLGEEINDISPQLYATSNFLAGFTSWLKSDQPHHLAILFQNSSEIRPTGGFVGSFAHLILDKGNMTSLEVNDIYDIDGQLEVKTIPPEPLRQITPYWGARDANWFFNFPTSAKKVIEFLELSKIYQERNVGFDGVIAINVEVIEDVLRVIGPLVILNDSEGSFKDSSVTPQNDTLTITADNFLVEIQRDVETDQNKDILKQLTPILFEKIGRLDDKQKSQLIEFVQSRIEHKEIMIYLDDLILEGFIQELGIGGEIAELPPDFFGEYLAVVNANIAGGKSDAFIDQQIKLSSRINNEGEIINNLTITRKHSGENEQDKWYQMTNKDYMQVLVPANSQLMKMSGYDDREASSGDKYPGRDVFSAWLSTPAGEDKTLTLSYKNPHKITDEYQFIFDRQSGARGGLEFSIEAPPGFIWQESGGAYFIYKNSNPPTRIAIELHLQKL